MNHVGICQTKRSNSPHLQELNSFGLDRMIQGDEDEHWIIPHHHLVDSNSLVRSMNYPWIVSGSYWSYRGSWTPADTSYQTNLKPCSIFSLRLKQHPCLVLSLFDYSAIFWWHLSGLYPVIYPPTPESMQYYIPRLSKILLYLMPYQVSKDWWITLVLYVSLRWINSACVPCSAHRPFSIK